MASTRAALPREDVLKIASAQRMLLWTILAAILINIALIGVRPPQVGASRELVLGYAVVSTGLALLLLVLQITSVVRLCLALHEGWATAVYAVFQIVPCVSLVLLLFLNGRATKRLQDCGIRVGLMGAKSADVTNYEMPGGRTCTGCGEPLEAGVATCPVCGMRVATA